MCVCVRGRERKRESERVGDGEKVVGGESK